MNRTVVAFGGNLPFAGQPPSHSFAAALSHLTLGLGHRLRAVARLWQSRPVDADGPDFVNTVAWIDTPLAPHDWLSCLMETEDRFGRRRPAARKPAAAGVFAHARSAARTLDLDLIWVEGQVIADARLTLPHPRAAQRAFVLGPLLDLEARLADLRLPCPKTRQPLSVSALWAQLSGASRAEVAPQTPSMDADPGWPALDQPPRTLLHTKQELGLA